MAFDDVPERTDHQALSLIGQQLDYLVCGDTGDGGPGSLERKITEKHSLLPTRLQYFIEDAALLRTAKFIDEEDWEDTWEELVESAGTNGSYSPPRAITRMDKSDFQYYQFGVQLGHLARLLSKGSAPEFKETEIVAGFLLGIAGEFLYYPELKRKISEDSSGDQYPIDIPLASIIAGPTDDEIEKIDSMRRSLIESQRTAPISHDEITAARALEKYGLPTFGPLRDEVWERTQEINKSPSDAVVESVAKKLVEDERIVQAEEIAIPIADDIDFLTRKKAGKKDHPVFAEEVFCAVCSQIKPNRQQIKNAVRETRRDKPAGQTINQLRNDIQGKGKDASQWEDHPLVEEVNGNYNPTNYGKLLGLIMTPDSEARETDEYLYTPDSDADINSMPDDEQLLIASYSCALGQPSETHQTIFDAAYKDRIAD